MTSYLRSLVVMDHLRSYFRNIFPRNEPDPVRDTIQVLTAGIGFSIFLVFLSFISMQYINHNRRIISECRLLDALVKEIETASKSVDQIKQRANQVWESELNLGITHTLSKIERRWLRNAGKVGSDAKQWAEDYETD
ncbi:hypothetical protein TorRG33x02_008520 [Trema orientale]|uniref:Uncharacterized protein n=1 Tax=Trema orientale TaxID=63057 RepID=A0A2P5G0U8_TREOI|nr:hypothetical protein TorRG33x02_008520 [Trema orientale]